ncbi:MAG: hypothetical protein P0Y64_16610 [Candidatus Sphingomonas colombiensis]|nr:hypothetical protein [Sphingomonas sp.]WEK42941.1 MAG: hypothetical protein P0Y64_16610 [Sphingomonas sp.]
MTSHRIIRTGRDWTTPGHMTDMQRERAEPAFEQPSRWVLITPFAGAVLWAALAGVVAAVIL